MKRIKHLIFLGFALFSFSQAMAQGVLARIKVSNNSHLTRSEEIIEIDLKTLPRIGRSFRAVYMPGKKEIISQLVYAGNNEPVKLLLSIPPIKAGESQIIELVGGGPSKVNSKTFGRFVPERKDDFAWENDKVAFRMYGKALETERDNAYGLDIWAKRTSNLVIDKWYKSKDYHNDHGEGMDYYSVGLTLGAGDIAPWHGDSISFPKNYHHYKVYDNGPLRTTFQLGYDEWRVGNAMVSATKTISLDAGSQMNRVEVVYQIKGASQVDVVMGITKRKQPGNILLDEKEGILGYWEPEIEGKGIMGIGVVAPEADEIRIDSNHLLAFAKATSGVPIVYYNGGVWNKAGQISSGLDWFQYLNDFRYAKENPLSIEIL